MESISIFDIIKIGIGPSSSHTMGPWKAAERFLVELSEQFKLDCINRMEIQLYGSLALTGIGHGTDTALMLGLSGEKVESIDPQNIPELIGRIKEEKRLLLAGTHPLSFDPDMHIRFHYGQYLEFHSNGLRFTAHAEDGSSLERTYYSIGGGFIATGSTDVILEESAHTPFPCHKAKDVIFHCGELNCSFSELVMKNELTWRPQSEITSKALAIWGEMVWCIFRGVGSEGELPGELHVRRRAGSFSLRLLGGSKPESPEAWILAVRSCNRDFKTISSWVSCFALAVNEENAAFGRVVTAPTNGASGVLPAVMMYAHCFEELSESDLVKFILVAGEIGSLFKKNATISAAEGGCQAEIGVSSAMAAAGLTECLGGSVEQVLMAAEIAMEHHLGLTCDPVGGLVQIPCIERNSMGAIKAITASNIALQSDPTHAKVSLDEVIRTMWETAKSMHHHYKETSEGGLATNVGVNVVEC